MLFDKSFYSAYECELVSAPPPDGILMYCFPGCILGGWVAGVGIKITPHSGSESWIGSFANGEDSSETPVSGVFSHPARNRVLVVAKGDGYVVNVDDPTDYTWLKQIVPIKGVIPVPDFDRIILYDFVRMISIGKNGILWRTHSLSWDGLSIENVRNGLVTGYGWDSPNNCRSYFEVNISSGESTGGASPELSRVSD
jgi:hypothetical protein